MSQFEVIRTDVDVPVGGTHDPEAVTAQSAIEIAALEGISYEEAQQRLAAKANFDPYTFLTAVAAGVDREAAMAEATADPERDAVVPPDYEPFLAELFGPDKRRAAFTIIRGEVDDGVDEQEQETTTEDPLPDGRVEGLMAPGVPIRPLRLSRGTRAMLHQIFSDDGMNNNNLRAIGVVDESTTPTRLLNISQETREMLRRVFSEENY